MPQIKLCVLYIHGANIYKHDARSNMQIKWTVWCTFQTNNYRFICLHTNNSIASLFPSLCIHYILSPYTLDTVNLNKVIFYVIAIGLQKKFYIETDMIMRLNVVLCSCAAFSCYKYVCILSFHSPFTEEIYRNREEKKDRWSWLRNIQIYLFNLSIV